MSSDEKNNTWFVYMVRCADDTLYTGVTTDLKRRVKEHNFDNKKGAKYTRFRRPVVLVYDEVVKDRSEGGKREAEIKKMTKREKETLISNDS